MSYSEFKALLSSPPDAYVFRSSMAAAALFAACASTVPVGNQYAAVVALHSSSQADILAMSQPQHNNAISQRGRIVLTSVDQSVPQVDIVPDAPVRGFGVVIANVGDVDSDQTDDLAVLDCNMRLLVEPRAVGDTAGVAAIDVFSGHSGALLVRARAPSGRLFGTAMASCGDIDNDGRRDFVVALASDSSDAQRCDGVAAISSATGQVLYEVPGPRTVRNFGNVIVAAGDLDGDGCADYFVGAPRSGYREPINVVSAVYAVSGRKGVLLYNVQSKDTVHDYDYGAEIAALGDIDDDGVGDIAISAPGAIDIDGVVRGIDLVSGATGAVIWSLSATDDRATIRGAFLGVQLCAVPDLDGDGKQDLLAVSLCPHGPDATTTMWGVSSRSGHVFRSVAYEGLWGWQVACTSGQRARGPGVVVLTSNNVHDGQVVGPCIVLDTDSWSISPYTR